MKLLVSSPRLPQSSIFCFSMTLAAMIFSTSITLALTFSSQGCHNKKCALMGAASSASSRPSFSSCPNPTSTAFQMTRPIRGRYGFRIRYRDDPARSATSWKRGQLFSSADENDDVNGSSDKHDLNGSSGAVGDHLSSERDDEDSALTPSSSQIATMDRILAKLTSLFPLFVLGSAMLGSHLPQSLNWVNRGNLISFMLAGVMLGTGMTLERSDFTSILTTSQRTSVPIGVLCQFVLMPISATMIGRTFLLPYHSPINAATGGPPQHLGKHLFLGLVLVGCSPGGTASNLVSLIARADVALSVLLTTCSTLLASIVTPLLTKWIVGSAVPVSGMQLCTATAKVVLAPVALGVLFNELAPGLCRAVGRLTPFASVILVSLICGGVVANNSGMWISSSAAASTTATAAVAGPSLALRIVFSVILTHILGFTAGYLVPKYLFRLSEKTSRTVSIETGMQNSALAVVLAKSIGAHPLSYLPGALSATAHSCLGSGLAAFWRVWDGRNKNDDHK